MTDLVPAMVETRARFLSLVAETRPELHRYCARMAGNVFDGEDIVQDTLAKAYFALCELGEAPPLRPWLFRIAHNTAMDLLRRYDRKHVDLVAEIPERAGPEAEHEGADPALVDAAISAFAPLPPVQRSALVLKDVLGHSLEETAATMGTTVLAVKGALARARTNVAIRTPDAPTAHLRTLEDQASLERYALLFNNRDWDGLRALMGEEARVDLVSRWQRRGAETRGYYGRYAELCQTEDRRAAVATVDGTAVLLVSRRDVADEGYFIRVSWAEGRIVSIRDYFYVPYLVAAADLPRAAGRA